MNGARRAHSWRCDQSRWAWVCRRRGAVAGRSVLDVRVAFTRWRGDGGSGWVCHGGRASEPACISGRHGRLLSCDGSLAAVIFRDGQPAATPQRMGSHRASRSSSRGLAALWGLHRRIRPRKHQRLMPVVAADEVWRCAVRSPDLDDLGRVVGRADNPAVHVQPVPHYRTHVSSSQ
jgi:hypothetical protein